MADRVTPALRLEEAKRDLEAKLDDAFRAYERRADGDIEVALEVDELNSADGPTAGDDELRIHLRNLLDAFHAQEIIKQTGVHVSRVTAIDSDADGTIALDVKYEYPA